MNSATTRGAELAGLAAPGLALGRDGEALGLAAARGLLLGADAQVEHRRRLGAGAGDDLQLAATAHSRLLTRGC